MLVGIDASKTSREDKTGTENYSTNLIKALAKVDKKNRYVLYFNKVPPFFEIGQPNFSSRIISSPRFWTQGRLAFECMISPPDVLFVPAHTMPVIHRPGLKSVVTIHDLGGEFLAEYHKFPQKIYLNWSTKFVAKRASHIIAVSNSTKKDLIKTLGTPAKRVTTVYEGVDRELYYPRNSDEIERVRLSYGLKKRYFLYVGTVQPRKNLARLIEAFAKTNLKHYDLVIAGSEGWLYEEIYQAPKKFNVEMNIKFLDYVPSKDLPVLYSGALALLFPSLYEGFGLPILEAFASGCPVVTSEISSTGEVAGEAAILINPEKVEEITRAINRIASNADLRKRLVEKGRARVENFSWEKAARETVKVFERAYKSK